MFPLFFFYVSSFRFLRKNACIFFCAEAGDFLQKKKGAPTEHKIGLASEKKKSMDLHTLEYENATIVVLCTYQRGPVYSSRVFGSWQLGTAQLLRFFWGTSRSGTAKEGKKKYGRYVNNRLDNCVNGLHKFGGKKNGKERKITEKKKYFPSAGTICQFHFFYSFKQSLRSIFFSEGKCHL